MRIVAAALFAAGLLLAVRVMFFGVQRRVDDEHMIFRKWPLALAGFFALSGALLYVRASGGARVTPGWFALVALVGIAAAAAASWVVKRSAAIPSTDPEDDPRYRFQGHVARVVQTIETRGDAPDGRIAFDFDGRTHELPARWSPEAAAASGGDSAAAAGEEVVIEFVERDVAYVEPWKVVEKRL